MGAGADVLDGRVRELLDRLATEPRAPGGGSAAAVAVSMAAALTAMAARVSSGQWAESAGAVAQAERLRKRVTPLVQADAEAYAQALELLEAGGDGTGEQRDWKLGAALGRAADVPFAIVESGADVAALAARVAAEGAAEVRGDAAAAALLAEAGARAAANLVAINLSTSDDDERVVRARELASAASASAGEALAARA